MNLQWLAFLSKREDGATLVEYGLVVFLIAAMLVAVVGVIGTELQAFFELPPLD